jgi:8-amino-7-oxononanoate synthase
MLTSALKQHSQALKLKGLYRQRQIHDASTQDINFSCNDYLSLASHPLIKKAYLRGYKQYPAGSGGSMVVCGYHSTHKALECAFSEALGVDDSVLFTSGYAANLSVIGLLSQFDAHILIDKSSHASIYDGLKLAAAKYTRYRHNDIDHLKLKMTQAPINQVVMTEGIFSMSGQAPPLGAIAKLVPNLIVDEAHAFGVVGAEGLGAVIQHQLTQADVPLRIIPLGKSFAASGAIISGQSAWIEALLQTARPYIYSTGISPAVAYGLTETLDVLRQADDRRQKLVDLVHYFRHAIARSHLTWRDSSTLIQQLQLGCSHIALHYANKLREHSIVCLPMRPPTVTQQETGLRIIINYHHNEADIDKLFNCIHSITPESK